MAVLTNTASAQGSVFWSGRDHQKIIGTITTAQPHNLTTMPSKLPSTFTQAWFKWKTLKLPWRKRFLVGMSLLEPVHAGSSHQSSNAS